MKSILMFGLALFLVKGLAQKSTFIFDSHGKQLDYISDNPFRGFIGAWTLKDDVWKHNWGGGTETIEIPKHHTISTPINTKNSLFSIIDGPEPNGHIFWSYNPVTKEVHHLSSFGELRAGVGKGSITKNGDLTLKINFEGEPQDTYRVYTYRWLSTDKYHMKSVQYTSDAKPTGLFYEGTFIRLKEDEGPSLKTKIRRILSVLDDSAISVEEQLEVYSPDIVHMAPGHETNVGKEMLGAFLKEQRAHGTVKMKHKVTDFEVYDDIVIMQGEVSGLYYAKNKTTPIEFKTKNLFVFDANEGGLKIRKVIYNSSPNTP